MCTATQQADIAIIATVEWLQQKLLSISCQLQRLKGTFGTPTKLNAINNIADRYHRCIHGIHQTGTRVELCPLARVQAGASGPARMSVSIYAVFNSRIQLYY